MEGFSIPSIAIYGFASTACRARWRVWRVSRAHTYVQRGSGEFCFLHAYRLSKPSIPSIIVFKTLSFKNYSRWRVLENYP